MVDSIVSKVSAAFPLPFPSAPHLSSLLEVLGKFDQIKRDRYEIGKQCNYAALRKVCYVLYVLCSTCLTTITFLNALRIYNHWKQFCQVSAK